MAGKLTKKQKKMLFYVGVGAVGLALIAVAVRGNKGNGGNGTACASGKVVFRTDKNMDPANFHYIGNQIAFDANGDGVLEAYIYSTYNSQASDRYDTIPSVGKTPEGYDIIKDGSYVIIRNNIHLSDQGYNIEYFFLPGGTINTSSVPTEPYSSNRQEIC